MPILQDAAPPSPTTLPDAEMLRLAARLEDGPLKRELLGAAWQPPAPQEPQEAHGRHEARLEFTGTGAEYFRIWIVHTLLSLLTLGLYSAWAKVRKARWFAQHTRLLGSGFDFDADPRRVLVGRIVAVVLLVGYSHAFDWSVTAGWVFYAIMVISGPALFASAQRFRLRYTRWRGLRFDFHVSAQRVYLTCVPLILIWTMGSVLGYAGFGVTYGDPTLLWILAATLLPLPLMHAQLKALQHRHARFGELQFGFRSQTVRMYRIWAAALFLAFVTWQIGLTFGSLAILELETGSEEGSAPWVLLLSAALCLVVYTLAWPYFAAKMQKVVWDSTTCGPLRFRGEMRTGPLTRLVLRNMLFTLLTAGLYWPFAAVALARYRVTSMVVCSDEPWPVVQAAAAGRADATGDAAVDAFGLDLGW